MPRKPKTPKRAALALPAKPDPIPPNTRAMHGRAVPGSVYQMAVRAMLGDQSGAVPDPSAFAQAVLSDMAPRDAAEEMLIAQMLFAHARSMRLTVLANQQTGIESLRVVNEYADRASNTYRRLMLALAEYRRPPRTGNTFAVVKQANIAGQQVVQNHENSNKNATNEQGCGRPSADHLPSHTAPPALPADTDGVGIPAFVRPARETLGARHRPADPRGQGTLPDERDKAR